ncbi:MAG: hypothetical protein DME85_10275 [Verrucomicrobia bacterium]|nr:MAG: hypothetical protein DME85_10275 [Verrucomicrobiota bacterium]
MRLFRFRFRYERRESAAVADAKDVNAICIDEIVFVQGTKRCAIAGEFRFEIVLRATAFTVTDTLLIDAK